MTFALTNNVKNIQVGLRECGYYVTPRDRVDGVWGSRSCIELQKLMEHYAWHLFGQGDKIVDMSKAAKVGGFPEAVSLIQKNLAQFGLYSGKIDGIFGNGSINGLYQLFTKYIEAVNSVSYGPAWSKLVPIAFYKRVEEWCASKNYFPNAASALMACMHFESGGTFSPSIQNRGGSNYFGLIQFGAAAAKDLGVKLTDIVKMTQMEQLELVFKYFEMWERYGKRITQLEDFYLVILYPAAVGKAADETLWVKGTKVFAQNNGFDKNKDGKISVGEISTTIYDTYYRGMDLNNRVRISIK